jgi:hypothetical protein
MLGQDRVVEAARVWLEHPENQKVINGRLTLQDAYFSQQKSTQDGI